MGSEVIEVVEDGDIAGGGEKDDVALPRIAIDLGRHRSFCALDEGNGQRLIPLDHENDGLVLRWLSDNGNERVTDRLLRLSGDQQDEATETIAAAASALFPELAVGDTLAGNPWVVVPPSFGPACRTAVVEGFNAVGVPIALRNLVDRPVAGLAGWIASHASHTNRPTGTALVIDNDSAQLSAAAADLDQRRILFSVPLSVGPDDEVAAVEERLRVLVKQAYQLRQPDEIVTPDDWKTIAGGIEHVVLTGSGCQHPGFLALVESVLPDATLVGVKASREQAHTIVFGALNLSALEDWTANWPTGKITLNDNIIRAAGPVLGDDLPLLATRNSTLAFAGPDGDRIMVRVGSVLSEGVKLPAELGLTPRLRLLSDGRLLVLGPAGSKPLSMRVQWPLPSAHRSTLSLEAIGRRAVELSQPRVDRQHRARAAS